MTAGAPRIRRAWPARAAAAPRTTASRLAPIARSDASAIPNATHQSSCSRSSRRTTSDRCDTAATPPTLGDTRPTRTSRSGPTSHADRSRHHTRAIQQAGTAPIPRRNDRLRATQSSVRSRHVAWCRRTAPTVRSLRSLMRGCRHAPTYGPANFRARPSHVTRRVPVPLRLAGCRPA